MVGDGGVKKPYNWWETHGAACPILQKLSLRIISQVTSSSSCERNWSPYGNLYNLKKTRLKQSKAKTMVYVPSSYLQEEGGVGEGKDKYVGCLSW